MAKPGSTPGDDAKLEDEALLVQRLMSAERLSIDEVQPGRTTFLSHVGAQPKLTPGPWVAHRDLLYALALANLTPEQRSSLASAVLVDHGREFGVGRLKLETVSSDLPLGGTSLLFSPRRGGPRCFYTWALGRGATPMACDWLLLRAQPEWALDPAPPTLSVTGLQTLAALGGQVLVLLPTAVAAVQVARACRGKLALGSHARFSSLLDDVDPAGSVVLWPHDGLQHTSMHPERFVAVALCGASEVVAQEVRSWAATHLDLDRVEIVDTSIPGRIDREGMKHFWQACGRPKVLLTGDPTWAASGAQGLRAMGAAVHVHVEATQLRLL